MGIKASATDLITPRFSNHSLSHTCQKRSNHQHTATQCSTLLDKLLTTEVVEIEFISLKMKHSLLFLTDFHTDVFQQLYQIVDVANVGNIAYNNLVVGEQRCTDHLQGLVFSALRDDGSTEQVSAFDFE